MLTKTKLALAAVLVAGTASLAVAQEADPNLLNRYPAYNGANGVSDAATITPGEFQSAPVALRQGRILRTAPVALPQGNVAPQTWTGRPQVQHYQYDSAPLISGGGY
jgi:hypothetical protein